METFTSISWLGLGTIVPVLTALKMIRYARAQGRDSRAGRISLALVSIVAMFTFLYTATAIAAFALNIPERDSYRQAQSYVVPLLDAQGPVTFPTFDSLVQSGLELLGVKARAPEAPTIEHHFASELTTICGYADAKNDEGVLCRSQWRVVLNGGELQEVHVDPGVPCEVAPIKTASGTNTGVGS